MLEFILGLLVGGLCGALTIIIVQGGKLADENLPKVNKNTEQTTKTE